MGTLLLCNTDKPYTLNMRAHLKITNLYDSNIRGSSQYKLLSTLTTGSHLNKIIRFTVNIYDKMN